jgi:hypothetical protein
MIQYRTQHWIHWWMSNWIHCWTSIWALRKRSVVLIFERFIEGFVRFNGRYLFWFYVCMIYRFSVWIFWVFIVRIFEVVRHFEVVLYFDLDLWSFSICKFYWDGVLMVCCSWAGSHGLDCCLVCVCRVIVG